MTARASELPPARLAGGYLMCFGVLGIVTGAVTLVVAYLRVVGIDFGTGPEDWAAHGVRALGLGVEWAALSSADGAFLGGLLLAAGIGWWRGRPWAPLVTLLYGIHGLLVTGVDLTIFAAQARPGLVRTTMLVADGVACAVALSALVGVLAWRCRQRRAKPRTACNELREGNP